MHLLIPLSARAKGCMCNLFFTEKKMTKTTDKILRIAELSDLCRTAVGLAGGVV